MIEFNENAYYGSIIDGNLAVQEGQEETWKIDNDSTADWAIEKIKAEQVEFQRIQNLIQSKMLYLQRELQKAQEKKDSKVGFFQNKLQEYFTTRPETALKATKTQKTYQLATGRLKSKIQAPEIQKDEEKLLEWLKDNGKKEFIQTKETPAWGEFKKTLTINNGVAVTSDGEIVEGITVQERPDKFEVEVE